MCKTLDNNDLNQVGHPAVLVKTRVWVGCSVLRAPKTCSRPFLLKVFSRSLQASPNVSFVVLPNLNKVEVEVEVMRGVG